MREKKSKVILAMKVMHKKEIKVRMDGVAFLSPAHSICRVALPRSSLIATDIK